MYAPGLVPSKANLNVRTFKQSIFASPFSRLTAEEAAALIGHDETVGFSAFTPAGAAKVIPRALAKRARAEHAAGRPFKIGVMTGASTGPSIDGELAAANAIKFRTPYQSDPELRRQINAGEVEFFDMHLSALPQVVRYGFLGPLHWAVVEACEVMPDGGIVLTSSVGASPTFLRCAQRVLIELNRGPGLVLHGLHDIYEPLDPPRRREIPVYSPRDRIGSPLVHIEPEKIAGIVETNLPDECGSFDPPGEVTQKIGAHVAEFLAAELRRGTMGKSLLPLQSGVGDIANAVLGALGAHPDVPPFVMYSEVLQDSALHLMRTGKLEFASATALTLSSREAQKFLQDLNFYRPRMILRPQEISNHPEVIRRLGIISINTALEVDIFGNVNSTHVFGRNMMSGIGGSGDFTRNAFLSIFVCPSLQKSGHISTIVPLVTHVDHSEHSVQVIITDQGVADLRGKSPHERAALITGRCAHPDFRDALRAYFGSVRGQTPHTLSRAFAFHEQYLRTGDMRGVKFT
ncbi:MAG: succinate CoA transferase [Verrucomicrobiota bacterium]|nr:succinate CoA transferase [Verrucomicrobiota bacterium]